MFKYFAYGLKITSEIELDELIVRDFKGEADIEIVFGETPDQINGPDWYGGWWQANDDCLLCDFTDVIRALVSRNGKSVTLQVFTEDDFQLRSFIFGQVLSACLLLRGYFLLHGACVKIGDKAVGFCGPSGVGKSTLTLAFLEEGYTIYSDDVIALKFNEDRLIMYPGFPRLRVTEKTISSMSDLLEDFEKINHFPAKLNYVKEFRFCSEAIELYDLIILNPTDCVKPNLRNISGLKKLNLFEEARYRKSIEELIYSEGDMLQRRTKVASIVKCYYLDRPNTSICVKQMMTCLSFTLS